MRGGPGKQIWRPGRCTGARRNIILGSAVCAVRHTLFLSVSRGRGGSFSAAVRGHCSGVRRMNWAGYCGFQRGKCSLRGVVSTVVVCASMLAGVSGISWRGRIWWCAGLGESRGSRGFGGFLLWRDSAGILGAVSASPGVGCSGFAIRARPSHGRSRESGVGRFRGWVPLGPGTPAFGRVWGAGARSGLVRALGWAAAGFGGPAIGLMAALFDGAEGGRWLLVGALGGLPVRSSTASWERRCRPSTTRRRVRRRRSGGGARRDAQSAPARPAMDGQRLGELPQFARRRGGGGGTVAVDGVRT